MSEIQSLMEFSFELADASAEAILPHFRTAPAVEDKGGKGWDPVTEGDRAAERAIRALIEKHYPTHGIVGEEYGTKKGSSAFTWVLDPIDGTRAFVIGLPVWTTLIGLYRDGQPYMGLMNQPVVGDRFYGGPDGTFLSHRGRTQTVRCRAPVHLSHARAGTTSPHLYPEQSRFPEISKAVQMMRFGGDAYFYALVAGGHLDIAMDPGLQVYDIAALIPIIKGAGGVVGTWDGKDPSLGGNVICASCQPLLDEAVKIMAG